MDKDGRLASTARATGWWMTMLCVGLGPAVVAAAPGICTKPVENTARFCTTGGPIVIPATESPDLQPIPAYPIPIDVAGTSGLIANLELVLEDFSHSRMDRLRLVLQSPGGQALVLRDGYAYNLGIATGLDYSAPRVVFADVANSDSQAPWPTDGAIHGPRFYPSPTRSGRSGVPAPGPVPPYLAFFDEFSGVPADGQWRLWVAQAGSRAAPAVGSIGRVCLEFDTAAGASPCASVPDVPVIGTIPAGATGSMISLQARPYFENCADADPDFPTTPGSIGGFDQIVVDALQEFERAPVDPSAHCVVLDPDYSACPGARPTVFVTQQRNGQEALIGVVPPMGRDRRAAKSVALEPGQPIRLRVGPAGTDGCPTFRLDLRYLEWGNRTDTVFRNGF